jgi:hypothetical protein
MGTRGRQQENRHDGDGGWLLVRRTPYALARAVRTRTPSSASMLHFS